MGAGEEGRSVSRPSQSVLPGLNVVLRDLGHGAQVLPAQGRQEHDEWQVDGWVVAPWDQLTVGEILCPDGGDDLPSFSGPGVRVGNSVINLWKKEENIINPRNLINICAHFLRQSATARHFMPIWPMRKLRLGEYKSNNPKPLPSKAGYQPSLCDTLALPGAAGPSHWALSQHLKEPAASTFFAEAEAVTWCREMLLRCRSCSPPYSHHSLCPGTLLPYSIPSLSPTSCPSLGLSFSRTPAPNAQVWPRASSGTFSAITLAEVE